MIRDQTGSNDDIDIHSSRVQYVGTSRADQTNKLF
jgi:hypothetical protein